MKVLVDKGELRLFGFLKKICHPELVRLPVGDLLVIGDQDALVVERKTVRDLIGSIRSNRLWSQLLRMLKSSEMLGYQIQRRLLVIQGGFWEHLNVSSVNEDRFWNSINGALFSINFVYGIPCVVCENNFAFESFLRILILRESKGKNNRLPETRWEQKQVSRLAAKDVKRYVLDAIPSIGETRAKLLLDHFETIENIARSSKDDLMTVNGIGERRAKIIYEIFH